MSIKNLEINEDWLYHQVDAIKLGKIIKSGGLKARRLLSKEDKRKSENGVWNGRHFISFAKKAEGEDTAYDHYMSGEFALIFDPDIGAIKTKVKEVGSIFETIAKLPTNKRFSRWKEEYQVKNFVPFDKVVGIKIPSGKRFWNVYEDDAIYQKKQLEGMLQTLDENNLDVPFIDVEEGKIVPKEEMEDYLDNKVKQEQQESNRKGK
ncbi:MAG: hypothetical protein IJF92_03715 [Bacilli bacterium]|nr:hypothetical protein [Bacilli bacterium]